MQSGFLRRAMGASQKPRRLHGPVAGVGLALLVVGCTHDGGPTASVMRAGGSTVAFESIDGPPVGVFQKLVSTLAEEANTRQLAVISRQSSPSYRVRAYLAVHIVRKQPRVGWVWDVYDADRRRSLRITGEEPGGRFSKDAWASADSEVLRRIARNGMDRLAAFVGNPDPVPGQQAPASPIEDDGGTMVARAPVGMPTATPAVLTVPLPPRRPQHSADAQPNAAAAITLAIAGH